MCLSTIPFRHFYWALASFQHGYWILMRIHFVEEIVQNIFFFFLCLNADIIAKMYWIQEFSQNFLLNITKTAASDLNSVCAVGSYKRLIQYIFCHTISWWDLLRCAKLNRSRGKECGWQNCVGSFLSFNSVFIDDLKSPDVSIKD